MRASLDGNSRVAPSPGRLGNVGYLAYHGC